MNKINWRSRKNNISINSILEYGSAVDVILPEKYIEIVVANDGGKPRPNCFDMKNRKEAVFNNLLAFKPEIGQDIFGIHETLKNNLETEKVLPFGRDPFGNFVCFDYRNTTENPPIIFWDHEADSDEGEEVLHFVSNSFNEFLDSLYEPED